MSVEAQGNPKRVDTVVINDDPEAPSILNPTTGDIFVTNPVGRYIMEVADGSKTVDQVIASVMGQFKGATAEVVGRDVHAFIREGIARGILVWRTP